MKPLEGLNILDMTDGIPYIGSMFSDYGANLIKVELPNEGDSIRKRGSSKGEDGPYTGFYLRGKKSFAVDYTTTEGRDIIYKIIKRVDMVVFNKLEDKLSEMGYDYKSIKEINTKIIYGNLTPFGEVGPWKDIPDYDLLVMAKSALLEKTGMPEKPTKFGFPLGYIYASWHLTAGMMAAYLESLNTGEGKKVTCDSWQTVMSLDDTFAQCFQGLNVLPKRIGNGFPTTNPTDTFKCKDGWFSLSIGSDTQWLNFVREAGKEADWGEGTVYAHDPDRSMKHYFGDLDKQLVEFFKTITLDEADDICRRAFVPGGPCNTVEELVKDDQVRTRNMLIDVYGQKQVGVPAKFSSDDKDGVISNKAPSIGENTEEILGGLDLSDEDIKNLKSKEIV